MPPLSAPRGAPGIPSQGCPRCSVCASLSHDQHFKPEQTACRSTRAYAPPCSRQPKRKLGGAPTPRAMHARAHPAAPAAVYQGQLHAAQLAVPLPPLRRRVRQLRSRAARTTCLAAPPFRDGSDSDSGARASVTVAAPTAALAPAAQPTARKTRCFMCAGSGPALPLNRTPAVGCSCLVVPAGWWCWDPAGAR